MIIETPERPKQRKHTQSESKIQADSFLWFHNSFPQYRGLLFACPNQNERSGELSKKAQLISGAMRKAIGVVAGVSDLILFIPRGNYHALCLECKTEIGKQSEEQKDWERKVSEQGYLYKIFRSKEQFRQIIDSYLTLEDK